MTYCSYHPLKPTFIKMHGAGNDFVIIDARDWPQPPQRCLIKALGDRNFGVGFDQLAVLTHCAIADIALTFWNADGSQSQACGNASRCVARILMQQKNTDIVTMQTGEILLTAKKGENNLISVNMGAPHFKWHKIPLAYNVDSDALPISGRPSGVGMGNPHCVFIVDDINSINVVEKGAIIERHPLFPQRCNVGFVEVIDSQTLRLRVWERGGMLTLACGSGACAALVVAHRKGLCGRRAVVRLDGGNLIIEWRDDGLWMAGPTALIFEGQLSQEFMDAVCCFCKTTTGSFY